MSIVVDLSVSFSPELPCWWPELEPFRVTPTFTLARENVASRSLVLEEHAGTHFDAGCHIGDGEHRLISAETGDQTDVAKFIGRARVVDVRDIRGRENGVSPEIGVARLREYEDATEPLCSEDIVVLWTGWSDDYFRPFPDGDRYIRLPLEGASPGWPAPASEAIEYLADRGITALALDTPTLGGLPDTLAAHQTAFKRNVTPIENLTNVGAIAGRPARFVFLPLKIVGSTGAPGRAIAILEGET